MLRIAVVYRGIPQAPGWATGDSVVRAFRRLGHEVYPVGNYYSQCAPDGSGATMRMVPLGPVPHGKMDLVLWMECNDADQQPGWIVFGIPARVRAYWDFDTAMHPDFTYLLASEGRFQRVFLANPKCLDMIPGAEYLPYAADPALFHPSEDPARRAIACGTAFKQRADFCRAAGVDLLHSLSHGDYAAAVRNNAIQVHNFASGGDGLLVMRIWETMGSRSCLLCERDASMLYHFEPGVHYVEYSGAEECRARVKWLLHDDNWRDVADRGYAAIMEEHTYDHRCSEILRRCGL